MKRKVEAINEEDACSHKRKRSESCVNKKRKHSDEGEEEEEGQRETKRQRCYEMVGVTSLLCKRDLLLYL